MEILCCETDHDFDECSQIKGGAMSLEGLSSMRCMGLCFVREME